MVQTIVELCEDCSRSFNRLYEALEKEGPDSSSRMHFASITDEIGRYNVWAGNVGAHQHGPSSLDYRLRDASQIREEFVKVLEYLRETLDDAVALLNRNQSPVKEPSSVSDSESDLSQEEQVADPGVSTPAMVYTPREEESQQLSQSISIIIASLYKLSTILRKGNLAEDRLLKSSKVDVAFDVAFDIEHVRRKFPLANDTLVERLGKAISRRRQYLKYWERHHEKLSMPRLNTFTAEQPVDQDRLEFFFRTKAASRAHTPQQPPKRGSGLAISHTGGGSTTASTHVPPKHQDSAEIYVDLYPESSSVSSCSSSTNGDERPQLPPIPQASEGSRDFGCPYCYTTCRLVGTKDWQLMRAWRRHIFKDLQPYMCTYQDCFKQGVMFERRAEWFRHETQIHRREWCCNVTGHSAFQDKEGFRKHLEEHHEESTSSTQLLSVLDLFERPMESTLASCSLCSAEGSSNLSAKRLEKHLASHMEALALLALPRANTAGNGESAGSNRHGIGTVEDINEIDLRQKARFDSVIQDFCKISAITSQTSYRVERSSDTQVSVDWLERVAQDMIVDGTYKSTYDDFMRNNENSVDISGLILKIYSGVLGDSPNNLSYNVGEQQDRYKEVLGFIKALYKHRPLNDAHAMRLAASLRDLSNDLQAALKQDEEATMSDMARYFVKPNVPIADNTMSLLRRALRAAKQLTSCLLLVTRELPADFRRKYASGREVGRLSRELSEDLAKLVSLLNDTERDQGIAHPIEQSGWSNEDKIEGLTTTSLIEAGLRDLRNGSIISTLDELNADVWDMLSLLGGPTSIDEDADGETEMLMGTMQILMGTTKMLMGTARLLMGTTQKLMETVQMLIGMTKMLMATTKMLMGTMKMLMSTTKMFRGTMN